MPKSNEEPEDIDRIAPPETEGTVRVDLDEPDDDDEEPGPAAARGDDDGEPPARVERDKDGQPRDGHGRWAQKKAERNARRAAERAAGGPPAWKVEKDALERRLDQQQQEFQRQMAELRATASRAPQGQGQPQDPHAQKMADIDAQIMTELALIEKDQGRDYSRYNQLQAAKTQAIVAQALAADRQERQREQANQPQDPYAARRPIIESEFAWVTQPRFEQLGRRAMAYKQYLVACEGRPDTVDTDREALAHAEAEWGPEYGLARPAARPAPRQQQAYYGPAHRNGPERNPRPRAVEIPRTFLEGAGLTAAQLRDALDDERR